MATLGFIYDCDTAAHVIRTRTALSEAVVAAVLASRDAYQLGLGILPPDAIEGVAPADVRAKHPDLFPERNMASRYIAEGLEREFVVRETGLDASIVERVQAADLAYMEAIGVVM